MIPLQETFDTVVAHLRKQKKQAINRDGVCQYKTADGLKCAAGCLIKDEDYQPDFEGMTVMTFSGVPNEPGELIASYGHDVDLVKRLQRVHDGTSDLEFWETGFKNTAITFGLNYEPPQTNNAGSQEL